MCYDLIKEMLPLAYVFKSPKKHIDHGRFKFSIGVIIQPKPRGIVETTSQLVTNPVQIANLWGHTAVYVRMDGKVADAVGFDPNRLAMFNVADMRTMRAVEAGTQPTTGYNYDEDSMFLSPDSVCIEFKLNKNDARKMLQRIRKQLDPTTQNLLQQYITRGGAFYNDYNPAIMGNCIHFLKVLSQNLGRYSYINNDLEIDVQQGHLTRAITNNNLQFKRTFKSRRKSYITGTTRALSMSKYYQASRRFGGTYRSYSLVTLIAHCVASLTGSSRFYIASGYQFTSISAAAVTLILNILMELIPFESKFWKQSLAVLSSLITGLSMVYFACMLATDGLDPLSFWELIWSLIPIFVLIFG